MKKKVVKIPISKEPVAPKKTPYMLKDDAKTRRNALEEGIKMVKNKYKINDRDAAIAKKKKLNVLRIYHKNKNPIYCRKITYDIKYLDKKYKLDQTKMIC